MGQDVEYPLIGFEYGIFLDSNISQLLRSGGLPPTASAVIVSGLEKGRTYYMSVRARNNGMDADGYSAWFHYSSNCSSFGLRERPSTCGMLSLGQPSRCVAPQVLSSGSTGVLSEWLPPLDSGEGSSPSTVSYQVQYGSRGNNGALGYLPTDDAGSLLRHFKSSLVVGRVYFFRCR